MKVEKNLNRFQRVWELVQQLNMRFEKWGKRNREKEKKQEGRNREKEGERSRENERSDNDDGMMKKRKISIIY